MKKAVASDGESFQLSAVSKNKVLDLRFQSPGPDTQHLISGNWSSLKAESRLLTTDR
jgi:hypothetical protein